MLVHQQAGKQMKEMQSIILGYTYYRKENYPVAQTFFEPLARNASLSSDPVTQDAYIRTADAYYMNRKLCTGKNHV